MSAQRKAARLAKRKSAISRREFLTGSAGLAAYAVLPAWARNPHGGAVLSGGGGGVTFNHFISTTGSDSNVGSLASPWAITAINTKQSTYAGTNLGILPGTYDVSGLMVVAHSPVFTINGGLTTPTYIGTCNSSGVYQAGTATLDAKGASGVNGGNTANYSTIMGTSTNQGSGAGPTPPNWGNWTVDGLIFVGFSVWAFQVGSFDGSGGQVPNTAILNCTFADSNTAGTNATGIHSGPVELYSYTNCLMSNCMFSNNTNAAITDPSHFQGITAWGGIGTGSSSGLQIQFCTFLNSCGIFGVYDTGTISSTQINNCYFDLTPTGVAGLQQNSAIQGFGNTAAPTTGSSSFHHNIVKAGNLFDGTASNTAQDSWNQPYSAYNNTWDLAGKSTSGAGAVQLGTKFFTHRAGIATCYNNLMFDNGSSAGLEYGYNSANTDSFALCDYNIYGAMNRFATYGASGGTGATNQTFATFKTAIGGLEANSSTNNTNPWTSGGSTYPSLAYQVASGSPAFQTGRVGGLSSGAACNVGAWDGTVTQVGSTLPVPA